MSKLSVSSTAPAIPLDPSVTAIRDGILAGLVLLLAFAAVVVIVRAGGKGRAFHARLQLGLLLAAVGVVGALGFIAYLNETAITSILGGIIGYVVGARQELLGRQAPSDQER